MPAPAEELRLPEATYRAFYTRTSIQWAPPAANDNVKKPPGKKGEHAWPFRDQALHNDLMIGEDEFDTVALNGFAFAKLIEFRKLIEAADHPVSAEHNHTGEEPDEEAGYGDGYGIEVRREYGPTPEQLKALWELGTEPAPKGEPWNPGEVKLDSGKTALGEKVIQLRQVGGLHFNTRGEPMLFKAGHRWLRFLDRTRGPKGERVQKAAAPDPNDIGKYTGAALPRNPKNGELDVGFIAGKSNPHDVIPAADNDNDATPGARGPQSSYDPYETQEAAKRSREFAEAKLQSYAGFLGRRSYEALHDAALGMHPGDIGGKRGDKRAEAIGKDRVRLAIERLYEEPGAPKGRPGNL